MKFELFIARRYLLKGRKNSFISIISLVSIIGIAIGVAALLIALALMNGFQGEIRDKILNSTAHIIINNMVGEGFEGSQAVIGSLKKRFPEIVSASPVIIGTVLIKGQLNESAGAVLRGVELNSAGNELWTKKLRQGALPLGKNEIIIGAEISRKIGLLDGEDCTIITPRPVLTPSGYIPRSKTMRTTGIFKTGLYEMDNGSVITSLETAQKLFGLKKKVTYIQIYIRDMFQAEELKKKLAAAIPPTLAVITWKDLNASLYSALELEKTVLFFTLTLIIIVASLNIIAGLILLVIQKIRDIGILLAYGASRKTIRRIFFIQGGIIGILGTSVGVAAGLLFCFFANQYELIKVPSEVYQMSFVPFRLGWIDFLAVVGVALLISFTATLIPSRKAASVNVVDAVKNE